MVRSARLSISKVADDDKCPRKPHIHILMCLKSLEEEFIEDKYTITGKILHEILQSVFTFDFPLVQFYYYKFRLSSAQALLKTMNLIGQRWLRLLKEPNQKYPWYEDFEMQGYIKESLDTEIPILANLGSTLVNNRLISHIIGTEFDVDFPIKQGYFIVGKIDLLAWNSDRTGIRIIELKTGQKKTSPDASQVLTYAEIIRKERPDLKIFPEIWYTKNNKKCEIKQLKLSEVDKEIPRIEEAILLAEKAKSEEEIPPMSSYCVKCNLCIKYMDLIFKEQNSHEKSLLDYF